MGTLVTALGCGIGKEEFDINKLRYHRVIIMTDADVDGSHIRTLLLTFFFRQMPQLLERGHIYIAQPPLFKIRKGKKERYLKDEPEKEAYLLELALADATIKAPLEAAADPERLPRLGRLYLKMKREVARLAKRYHPDVLQVICLMPRLAMTNGVDRPQVEAWFEDLRDRLAALDSNGAQHQVEVFAAAEGYGGRVDVTAPGATSANVFDPVFFASPEYLNLSALENQFDFETLEVSRGDKEFAAESVAQAIDWLLDEAAQGLHLQRYKGLGEMNPEQLWETTMDASTRNLFQVNIEDAVAADEIFTTLMGDHVEPRKDFIEAHAQTVENIDI